MARVIICRSCDTENPIAAGGKLPRVCSNCTASLGGISPTEARPSGGADEGGAKASDPESAGSSGEETVDAPALVLEFPFGPVAIMGETLIGRDNLEFGSRIANSPNGDCVSGRHAVIACREGRFFIRHIGRTDRNFTYVDDCKIDDEVQLRDGQRLSLSTEYHLTVRIR